MQASVVDTRYFYFVLAKLFMFAFIGVSPPTNRYTVLYAGSYNSFRLYRPVIIVIERVTLNAMLLIKWDEKLVFKIILIPVLW